MTRPTKDLLDLAANYHKGLPQRIRRYLNERGIPDVLIDFHLLGWNGRRVTIPILDREGRVAFFKLARDPEDRSGPKMMATRGSYVELYGWGHVLARPRELVVCEGEFDRFVLESKGFRAVTSTGGAGTFRQEWAQEFAEIPEVYVCFDRDNAGKSGALRVGRTIPHAKIVELPEEAGQGGDATDFFVRLGKSREDFLELLEQARPVPPAPEPEIPRHAAMVRAADSLLTQRIERIKSQTPIADVIGQYVKLRPSGNTLVGLCPFHDDRNPSLVVYPETRTFHCYGCAKHGDIITFIREIEHLSFGQALDALDAFSSRHESNQ